MPTNAVGKPRSTSFVPNYKVRTVLTKIGRLRKPYGPGFGQEHHGRRHRRPRPAPLLDLMMKD